MLGGGCGEVGSEVVLICKEFLNLVVEWHWPVAWIKAGKQATPTREVRMGLLSVDLTAASLVYI